MWLAQLEGTPKVILGLSNNKKTAKDICYLHMLSNHTDVNMWDFTHDPDDVYDYPAVTDYLTCNAINRHTNNIVAKYSISFLTVMDILTE